MADYKLGKGVIIRTNDGANIPLDIGNKDFLVYLEWAKTNTPDPMDPDPVPTNEEKRAAEYPSIQEQLEAMWVGGLEAETMRQKILAIIAKYPREIAPTTRDTRL